MRPKTQRTDFTFIPAGYGAYLVTYISPRTGKRWVAKITDMDLLDSVRDDFPKRKDLDALKGQVKSRGITWAEFETKGLRL